MYSDSRIDIRQQIAPVTFAVGGFAHEALVLKAEALIQVPGAGVVLINIEKQPMGVKFTKGDADQFCEHTAAKSALGHGYHDTLEFNGV